MVLNVPLKSGTLAAPYDSLDFPGKSGSCRAVGFSPVACHAFSMSSLLGIPGVRPTIDFPRKIGFLPHRRILASRLLCFQHALRSWESLALDLPSIFQGKSG